MTEIYDGQWRLIEFDPATGRSIWMIMEDDGGMHFEVRYPADATIEANKEARASSAGKPFGEWARVASIPLNFFHASGLAEAMAQGDDRFVSKVLNDADNRAWRTKEGKV